MRYKLLTYLLSGLFVLITHLAWTQDASNSVLLPAKSPPYTGKQIRYTKEGKLHTVIHYQKGEIVRYRDYFRDGELFQDISYRNGVEHGRYLMYNEVAEVVLKGKKKDGNYYSGQFDQWDKAIYAYLILTYNRGKVVKSQLLSELHTALTQDN